MRSPSVCYLAWKLSHDAHGKQARPRNAGTITYAGGPSPIYHSIAGHRLAAGAAQSPYAPYGYALPHPGTAVGTSVSRNLARAYAARWVRHVRRRTMCST